MSTRSTTEREFDNAVAAILGADPSLVFRKNFELAKEAIGTDSVRAFYHRTEEGYASLVWITDYLLVDVEDDAQGRTDPGRATSAVSTAVYTDRLGDLGELTYFTQPAPTPLSRAEGSRLVLMARFATGPQFGPYWVAKTEEQEVQLRAFGSALLKGLQASCARLEGR